jgi:hypothetical protein
VRPPNLLRNQIDIKVLPRSRAYFCNLHGDCTVGALPRRAAPRRGPKRKYWRPVGFEKQPRVANILKLASRKRGVTAAEAAKALGWRPASIRAVISRLESSAETQLGRQWDHN